MNRDDHGLSAQDVMMRNMTNIFINVFITWASCIDRRQCSQLHISRRLWITVCLYYSSITSVSCPTSSTAQPFHQAPVVGAGAELGHCNIAPSLQKYVICSAETLQNSFRMVHRTRCSLPDQLTHDADTATTARRSRQQPTIACNFTAKI